MNTTKLHVSECFDFRGFNVQLSYLNPKFSSDFIIYTADIGNYSGFENIMISAKRNPNFEFVIFTDNLVESSQPNLKLIEVKHNKADPRVIAKYFKINSSRIFSRCKKSLWIDSNMELAEYDFDKFLGDSIDFAYFSHDKRSSVIEELNDIRRFSKEASTALQNFERDFITENDAVEKLGLAQGRFLCRRRNEDVAAFESIWWDLILRYSIRDQLTLPFAVSKSSLRTDLLNFMSAQNYFMVKPHLLYRFQTRDKGVSATIRHALGYFRYKLGLLRRRIIEPEGRRF